MRIRKLVLAAGMALAAVAAMAPMAQAEITDNGQSITLTEVLHYEGTMRFDAGPGVFLECPVTAELHVSAFGETSVRSFAPATNNCTGGGPFAGCFIESDSFGSEFVHVDTFIPDLKITTFTIRYNYEPGSCAAPILSTHLFFPQITLRTEIFDPHSMDTLKISGTAGAIEGTSAGPVASGQLHITPLDEGTYTLDT